MSWSYRVVRTKARHPIPKSATASGKLEPYLFGIHEVYYDSRMNPYMATEDPIDLGNVESLAELRKMYHMMAEAFRGDVLSMEDIERKGRANTSLRRRRKAPAKK